MNNLLYCDTETYSEVPISNGTHAYAEAAEIMLFAYAWNDEPVQVWDRTLNPKMPDDLRVKLMNPTTMTVWHNGGNFDRTVMRHSLGIDLSVRRMHDTMVQALTHGLPGGLGTLCEIMGVPADKAKDKQGRYYISLFCKPRPANSDIPRATRETHPEEWAGFKQYATQDIEAMRFIMKKMPMWNYTGAERELWNLDQQINDRGILIDLDLAKSALVEVEKLQKQLAVDVKDMTLGLVGSATQRDEMLAFILEAHGVSLPDMQAATLERRLNDPNLPVEVRELIAARQQASTTSTSKYKTLIKAVSKDGRLRGMLQFCGASRTGRWSGRTFQPQNLPSKGLPKHQDIEFAIEAIKCGGLDVFFKEPMKLASAAIRGCLVASPRKVLCISDLANIEGRDAAWLAGEEWKLDAFRAYDLGVGDDLYRLSYAKSFSIPVEEVDGGKEKGLHRQIGKVQELALAYEGGVGAFITFAAVYGIDLEKMAADAWPTIPEDKQYEAKSAWEWAIKNRRTYGLTGLAYMTCDALKRMWREAHPEISSYWPELQAAAIQAVMYPGQTVKARKLKFRCDGAWLRMGLPSGRAVCYASPKIESNKLTYMGMNQYSRKWTRMGTYGGKLFENACQSVARDVMAYNMPAIEEAGYKILLTVHDEVVTEADELVADYNELSRLLATNPSWAKDLPLAADGFQAKRYRKDD